MSIKTRLVRNAAVADDPAQVLSRAVFDELKQEIAAIPANTSAWREDHMGSYFMWHPEEGENQAIIEAAVLTVETLLVNDYTVVQIAKNAEWPGGPQMLVRALCYYGYLDNKANEIADMHGYDPDAE